MIPLTVVRTGPKRIELRGAAGDVIATAPGTNRARELVRAIEATCAPGERLGVTLVGITDAAWRGAGP